MRVRILFSPAKPELAHSTQKPSSVNKRTEASSWRTSSSIHKTVGGLPFNVRAAAGGFRISVASLRSGFEGRLTQFRPAGLSVPQTRSEAAQSSRVSTQHFHLIPHQTANSTRGRRLRYTKVCRAESGRYRNEYCTCHEHAQRFFFSCSSVDPPRIDRSYILAGGARLSAIRRQQSSQPYPHSDHQGDCGRRRVERTRRACKGHVVSRFEGCGGRANERERPV